MSYSIKFAEKEDFNTIYNIQTKGFEEHLWQSRETLIQGYNFFPRGTFLIIDNDTNKPCAYTLTFPSKRGRIGVDNLSDFEGSDCYHIHDVCILPEYQRKGISKLILEKINEITRNCGFKLQTLLAIPGKTKYWKKQGFVFVEYIDGTDYYIVGDSMERYLK